MNLVATKSVMNGDNFSMMNMGKETDVDEEMKAGMKEQIQMFSELLYSQAGYTINLYPTVEILEDKEAYLVNITKPSGETTKAWYDVSSGLKLKQETTESEGGGVSTIVYSNYQSVDGIQLAFHQVMNQGFEIEIDMKEVKFNGGLSDEEFK